MRPTSAPNTGPTLATEVQAAVTDVRTLNPVSDSITASTPKVRMKRVKNTITESITSPSTRRPPYRTATTAEGLVSRAICTFTASSKIR